VLPGKRLVGRSHQMASLTHNIIANYVKRIWTAALSIACIPFYIEFIGMAPYGLLGFYMILSNVFGILDLGIGTTLDRELARRPFCCVAGCADQRRICKSAGGRERFCQRSIFRCLVALPASINLTGSIRACSKATGDTPRRTPRTRLWESWRPNWTELSLGG
jgi:hypothetical protein